MKGKKRVGYYPAEGRTREIFTQGEGEMEGGYPRYPREGREREVQRANKFNGSVTAQRDCLTKALEIMAG